MQRTQEEMENFNWVVTPRKNILKCLEINKFHFVNETEMLDEEDYNSLEECEQALIQYANQL